MKFKSIFYGKDVKKGMEQLYKDAVYYHFIHQGYSNKKARKEIRHVFQIETT